MTPFQAGLIIIGALIFSVLVAFIPEENGKLKKEKQQAQESIQKRKDIFQELNGDKKEEYVNFLTKLKYMDKIYVTDQGTVLNSKPHTFKDFINNQKLPSQLELVWEILADNNETVKDIIQRIEDGGPYDPNSKVVQQKVLLKVTKEQEKLLGATNLTMSLIKIDDNYPLFGRIERIMGPSGHVLITYQAGYGYDDKNLDRGYPTKPTKY